MLINERDKDGNFLELGKEFILAPNDHFNNLPVNISLSDVQVPTNMYNKGKPYCCWSFGRVKGQGMRGRGGWFEILCFFEKCDYKPSVSSIGSIGEVCASSAWRSRLAIFLVHVALGRLNLQSIGWQTFL